MLPELYPSLGDPTRTGVDYNFNNPDDQEHVLATFLLQEDETKSFYVRAVMVADAVEAFAQFEISGVFDNKANVLSRKFDVDKVTNPANPDNKLYFVMNGPNVEIRCTSGINSLTYWSSTIAIVGISGPL